MAWEWAGGWAVEGGVRQIGGKMCVMFEKGLDWVLVGGLMLT
jgi:hypothetical protein